MKSYCWDKICQYICNKFFIRKLFVPFCNLTA